MNHPLLTVGYRNSLPLLYCFLFLPLGKLCVCVCSVLSNSLQPTNCSPSDSSIHRIFQARVLEWVAIAFFRGSSRPRDRTQVSCIVGRRFYPLSHNPLPIPKSVLAICCCITHFAKIKWCKIPLTFSFTVFWCLDSGRQFFLMVFHEDAIKW